MTSTSSPAPLSLGLEFISGARWTGGAQYLRNVVRILASLPEDERPHIRLIGVPVGEAAFVAELTAWPDVSTVEPPAALGRAAWFWRKAKRRAARVLSIPVPTDREWHGLDVTYPAFASPVPGVPQIAWLADLQHVHLPQFFSPEELAVRQAGVAQLAARPGVLVLSSEDAREDFLAQQPNPVCQPRVWSFCTVLGHEDRAGADPVAAYGLPAKYLYLPNQFWAHKNHITVFRALALLKQRGETIPVVCTGLQDDYRNNTHFAELMAFIAESGLAEQIHMLGLLPRPEQISVFRHAALVVQPSLFEGWSTVVEDCKAVGRPLLASDLAVHAEQLRDYGNGSLFERSNPEALAQSIAAWWPKLSAGPDAAAERMAAEQSAARCLRAGRRFMGIAREAVALARD